MLDDERSLPALYIVWPHTRLASDLDVAIPAGYELRPYRNGDERALYHLFEAEGWKIEDADWQDYLERVIPRGLFLLWHAESNIPVATAGAIHNPRGGRYYFPFGGELAYLIVDPGHRGHGLGTVLGGLVVRRLLAAGYETIWTGVQGYRLPAIKTYLRLGFVPLLHQEDLAKRWQRIYEQIGRQFTPESWPTKVDYSAP